MVEQSYRGIRGAPGREKEIKGAAEA